MKLSRRVAATVAGAMAAAIIAVFILANTLILGGFADLERENAAADVARVQRTLAEDIQILDLTTKDWAHWDDTYTYVQGDNAAFEASSLAAPAFAANRLNAMVFLDANGTTVFAQGYDLEADTFRTLPQRLQDLGPDDVLLDLPTTDSSVAGFTPSPEHPLLVAARPILTSEETGPIAGTLIWARYLDTDVVANLEERTQLDIALTPLDGTSTFAGPDEPPDSVHFRLLGDETIVAHTTLTGIEGEPILDLEVAQPRTFYQSGEATVGFFFLTYVLVAALVAIVTIAVLHRTATRRLANLTASAEAIRSRGTFEQRLATDGRDEITRLAHEFNALLDRVQQHTHGLEEANLRLGDFASVVSHDLKNPLNALIIHAYTLHKAYGETLPEEAKQMLVQIRQRAEGMADLISAVLEYSRAATADIHREPVDLNTVIHEVEVVLATQRNERGVRLEKDTLPTVHANRVQMLQLFQNLISNAIKFTPDGVAPAIRLTGTRRDGRWRISIADNGPGIDPAEQERIFEPFRRAATPDQRDGHGLGLATCAKIVQRHDGAITVESTPGAGCTFHIDLPPAREDDTPKHV